MRAVQEVREALSDAVTHFASIETDDCQYTINKLMFRLPDVASIFYPLLNGWFYGIWADYDSCINVGADAQYVLARVNGNYTGILDFSRGSIGKYTNGFSTAIGLCLPKACTITDQRFMTEDLILGPAKALGWENATVSYQQSSEEIKPLLESSTNLRTLIAVFACIIFLATLG